MVASLFQIPPKDFIEIVIKYLYFKTKITFLLSTVSLLWTRTTYKSSSCPLWTCTSYFKPHVFRTGGKGLPAELIMHFIISLTLLALCQRLQVYFAALLCTIPSFVTFSAICGIQIVVIYSREGLSRD